MPASGDLFSGVLPFFHVAEERSYRRAAARLGVSAAAVSKAVQRLEETVGAKLLARTSRSVALTPEGAEFLERCREAIASLQAGREVLTAARRAPRGEVRLSLSFILGGKVVAALPRLGARYPNLVVRVSMTDRLVRLVDEGIDVAVRVGALPDSSLVSRRLAAPRWVTVAAPSYVARHGPPAHPDDLLRLNGLRFVGPSGRPRDWVFADPRTGAVQARKAAGNLLIDQGEHLLAAAVAGLGVCQVLDFMADGPVRQGALVELLPAWSAAGPPIHAVATRERAASPNVRAILTFLVESFAS